jgi:DNA excision repair protein ERCC-4
MGKARSNFPSDLRPEDIAVVVDSREQNPFDLSPLRMVGGTLPTADYSVRGLEPHIAIERKSLDDLLGCIGGGRPRFERELRRLLGYDVRAVVVEAGWTDLEAGEWRSKVTPAAAVASVLGWTSWGIPFILAGDRGRAEKYTARILYLSARRKYREARSLVIGQDDEVVADVSEENGVETAVQEGSKI